jgi:hypothetical protein
MVVSGMRRSDFLVAGWHYNTRPAVAQARGMKVHRDDKDVLQGVDSEKAQTWTPDERVWQALQGFLFAPTHHPLIFGDDKRDQTLNDYVEMYLAECRI